MEKIEKKIAGHYDSEHGGQQPAQQPAAPAQPAPPPQEEHHAKDFAKKLGNAATFGAGATAGADAVNSIVH